MVMRLNGFSSGMDIDSTVKQLMAARRIPLDKILQKKQTLQWKQDGYREMNSKLLDLRDSAFKMKLQSTYLAKKTSSNDESAISAVGTSSATDGIYKINIAQLAEAASATSTGSVGTNIKTTSKIVDVDPSLDADPLEKGDILTTLTIGGEKGTATIEVNDEATC
jgi:flagellar hook-associated protein 2